jgi:hypothetical protein
MGREDVFSDVQPLRKRLHVQPLRVPAPDNDHVSATTMTRHVAPMDWSAFASCSPPVTYESVAAGDGSGWYGITRRRDGGGKRGSASRRDVRGTRRSRQNSPRPRNGRTRRHSEKHNHVVSCVAMSLQFVGAAPLRAAPTQPPVQDKVSGLSRHSSRPTRPPSEAEDERGSKGCAGRLTVV